MVFGFDENDIFEKIDFWTKKRKYILSRSEADMMQRSLRLGLAAEVGGAFIGGGLTLLAVRKFTNPIHISSLAKVIATGSVVLGGAVVTAEAVKCYNKVNTVKSILKLENSVIAATTKEIMRSSPHRDVFRERYPDFKAYLDSRSWERSQPDPALLAAIEAANERRVTVVRSISQGKEGDSKNPEWDTPAGSKLEQQSEVVIQNQPLKE